MFATDAARPWMWSRPGSEKDERCWGMSIIGEDVQEHSLETAYGPSEPGRGCGTGHIPDVAAEPRSSGAGKVSCNQLIERTVENAVRKALEGREAGGRGC
jgi:hypothetical protein